MGIRFLPITLNGSSWSPSKLPGLNLWLDATDNSTITGGAPATAWKSKSLDQTVYSAPSGYEPSILAGAINGQQVMNFGITSGHGQLFVAPSASALINNTDGWYMYIVLKNTGGGVTQTNASVLGINTNAGHNAYMGIFNSDGTYGNVFFGGPQGDGWQIPRMAGCPTIDSSAVFEIGFESTAGYNDVTKMTGYVNNTSYSVTQTGADVGSGGNRTAFCSTPYSSSPVSVGGTGFQGYIGEIIVGKTPGGLSVSDRNNLKAYFTNKWSIGTVSALFDGSTSYGGLGSNFNWDYTQAFSVNVWVKPEFQEHNPGSTHEALQALLGNYYEPGGELTPFYGWQFGLGDDGMAPSPSNTLTPYLELMAGGDGGGAPDDYRVYKYGTYSDFLNTWVMASCTSNGTGLLSGIKVWLNGVDLSATISQDNLQNQSILSPANTVIGALSNFAGTINHFFKGRMTNLSIWDDALPPVSISALYSGGRLSSPLSNPSASSLTNLYPMNGVLDTSMIVKDTVGGIDATNNGITFIADV